MAQVGRFEVQHTFLTDMKAWEFAMIATQVCRNTVQDSLAQLGLMLPVTVDDVREAYFQRAMHMHPDRGGDAKTFQRLHAAYKSAKAYAASRGIKWLAPRIESYVVQQKVVQRVRDLGGFVELAETAWLRKEVGDDFVHIFDRIVGIYVNGPNADDSFVRFLVDHRRVLAHLRSLDLTASGVTIPTLRTLLHCMPKLKWLGMKDVAVSRWHRFKLKYSFPHISFVT